MQIILYFPQTFRYIDNILNIENNNTSCDVPCALCSDFNFNIPNLHKLLYSFVKQNKYKIICAKSKMLIITSQQKTVKTSDNILHVDFIIP